MTALMRPPAAGPAASRIDLEVVTLRLAGEVFAVPTRLLREVIEPVRITRVPGASRVAAGLLNVRGAVVPLADLRVPLRMPIAPPGPDARILVLDLELDGRPAVVGVHADSVHEVTRLERAGLEEIPSVGSRWPPRFVAAIGRWHGGFVTILDLPAIFAEVLAGAAGPSHAAGPAPLAQS